ncbi:hypothetical protein F4860DRAFT_465535 [Xylaria cubensis]|nr:hypothetical protein F4860DRAFT_465535 [Xylaria cubensis]
MRYPTTPRLLLISSSQSATQRKDKTAGSRKRTRHQHHPFPLRQINKLFYACQLLLTLFATRSKRPIIASRAALIVAIGHCSSGDSDYLRIPFWFQVGKLLDQSRPPLPLYSSSGRLLSFWTPQTCDQALECVPPLPSPSESHHTPARRYRLAPICLSASAHVFIVSLSYICSHGLPASACAAYL